MVILLLGAYTFVVILELRGGGGGGNFPFPSPHIALAAVASADNRLKDNLDALTQNQLRTQGDSNKLIDRGS